MKKITVFVLCMLAAVSAHAQFVQQLTGTGGGGAYQDSDRIGFQTWNKVRLNFDVLNTLIKTGTGSPEGAVTAGVGSYYRQTNGSDGTTFWLKVSGTGNAGWKAIPTLTSTGTFTNKTMTGPDGSSSAPTYSYASDTTLGFYRVSSGVQGLRGTLLPASTSTYDFGSGSVRWRRLFFDQMMIADQDLSTWLTNGTDPTVSTVVISKTYTGTPATDVYGMFNSQTFNPAGNNATHDYYGFYSEGTQYHTTARNARNHYGNYFAAYSDKDGNWDSYNAAVCDSEYGGTGTVGLLACFNAGYWGSYNPTAGTAGTVTLATAVHVGQPFEGDTPATTVASVDIEDVTAAGAITTAPLNIWVNRYTNANSSTGGMGRHGAFVDLKDTVTVADNGGGTNATVTITPGASLVKITCNDTNGCDITMGETNIYDGQQVRLINVSANTCNFADTSGVSELIGAFAAGQWDSITLEYVTDRWVELYRSNN